MVVACRHVDVPAGRTLRIAIGDRDAVETLLDDEEPPADTFDEYRGGLGFRLVLASRIIGAHGGRVSSPGVDPGRLAIVVTLPVAP
jgi:signal transduction histidine kinase